MHLPNKAYKYGKWQIRNFKENLTTMLEVRVEREGGLQSTRGGEGKGHIPGWLAVRFKHLAYEQD